MTTITVELSETQQEFVQAQVAELGIASPEEYLEKLIQEERKRKLGEYYMAEIQKGLESGPPIPSEIVWKRLEEKMRLRRESRELQEAGQ